jgi:hypothetical protein
MASIRPRDSKIGAFWLRHPANLRQIRTFHAAARKAQ